MSRLEIKNMRLFIVRGFSRLRLLVKMLPASEKLFLDMALNVSMHMMDHATRVSIGNRSMSLLLQPNKM